MPTFNVRDLRTKEKFFIDDDYLNGWAKLFDPHTSVVYFSLCRHADGDQVCFPSQELIAEQHNIGVRTVIDKLALLEKCNIIRKERERDGKGRWRRNTYYLLDKSEWTLPSAGVAGGHPSAADCTIQVQELHTKDTHRKDTHTISKDIAKSEFGNGDINFLTDYLKEKLNLPLLDGSVKENRRYCYLLINKFEGRERVERVVEAAAANEFWRNKITSFKTLYYNAVRVIAETREGGVVDAAGL